MDVLPPDPYKALGVARDATSAIIKTAYRKAALKCHPDKVEGKGEEFYRIQQAYEILGDDVRRQQYDDETRLAELRKDMFGKKGVGSMPNVEVRTPSYEVRSSSNSMGPGYSARSSARMGEERRHSATKTPYDDLYTDDYFESRNNSRKYDGRPSARPSRSGDNAAGIKLEKTIPKEKERMEREKQRARAENQDRNRKYAYVDDEDDESSNSDEKGRYEPPRRRHNENERPRNDRPRTEPRSSDEDLNYEKLQTQESERMNYIRRSKAEASAAPYTPRDSPPPPSSYTRVQDPYELRKGTQPERPAFIRRNSTTRNKEKPVVVEPPPRLSRRDSVSRRSSEQEIPVHTASVRRPAPLTSTQSTPANMKLPLSMDDPRRTRTEYPERPAPHPRMQRAETMPTKSTSNSRPPPPRTRESANTPVVSSNLRHGETNDSGYSTSSPSETAPPQSFSQPPAPPTSFKQPTKYFYGEPATMVEEPMGNAPIDYGTATRPATILREPSASRTRHHSPSPPLDRHERPSVKNPPLSRSASHMHHTSSDRATSRERAKTTTSGSIRRPGISRSDSSRATTRGPIPRTNVPLPQLKTPGLAAGPFATAPHSAVPSYFPEGYTMRSASPQEMYNRAAQPEISRTSRKAAPPSREDSGYGPELGAQWDEEAAAFSAAPPKMMSGNRRSYTVDSAGGIGRSATVREMKESRGDPREVLRERDGLRERDRDRDSPRERERERDRDRDRDRGSDRDRERVREKEKERERERERAYDRERPRVQTRRTATMEAY